MRDLWTKVTHARTQHRPEATNPRSHRWPDGRRLDARRFSGPRCRAAVDKALQRLAADGDIRRLDRGLDDRPKLNSLTKKQSPPHTRAIIDAVVRRDQARVVVDGMTAANDLGLTTAVPTQVTVPDRCVSAATSYLGRSRSVFDRPPRADFTGPADGECAWCKRSLAA